MRSILITKPIKVKNNPNLLKSRFGALAALGVGTVAAGVGAGALVKQFRNDDPSTYLTNDNQMEGMIISDVEQEFNVTIYDFRDRYVDLPIWMDVTHIAYHPDSMIYSQEIADMILSELP